MTTARDLVPLTLRPTLFVDPTPLGSDTIASILVTGYELGRTGTRAGGETRRSFLHPQCERQPIRYIAFCGAERAGDPFL